MKNILVLLIISWYSFPAKAQLISNNAFIKGSFVEAGISPCGNFGSMVDAPSGYHPRSGTSGSGRANYLGFVADPDMDGWDVDLDGIGGNYHGDYFMPAAPRIGWGIQFNGTSYGNERSHTSGCGILMGSSAVFGGSIESVVTLPDGGMVAIWIGANAGVQVKKEFTVPVNKTYITIKVTVTNTSVSTVNNIYYGEYLNPDNGYFYNNLQTSSLSTINSISLQNPIDSAALVSSLYVNSGDSVYLGLGTLDCRARVIRSINSSLEPTGVVRTWYDGNANISMSDGDTSAANRSIGIAYRIGNLLPAGSTSFTYAYILNKHHLNDALAESDPVIIVNGQQYNDGDTAYVCSGNASLIIGNAGSADIWNWSADYPVLSANTGVNNTATLEAGSMVAINATSVSSCGTKSVNVVVMSANRFYVNGSVTNSGTGYSWDSPFKTLSEALKKMNTPGCIAEIWVAQGTYYPHYDPVNLTSNPANPRDVTFRLVNNVKVYGGFAGNETHISQRNISVNESILSGDIGTLNDSTDNAYHVVVSLGDVGSAELNGFTVTKGLANDTTHLGLFPRYAGAGIYVRDGAPLIKNCIITRNATIVGVFPGDGINLRGGAVTYLNSNAVLDSVKIIYNRAVNCFGAGMSSKNSNLSITHSVVSHNVNSSTGGGIYFTGSNHLTINNLYVESNQAGTGGGLVVINSTDTLSASVNNTYIRGNTAVNFGAVSIETDAAVLGILNFSFDNCQITGNRTTGSNSLGRFQGNIFIRNSIIASNRVGSNLPGIQVNRGTTNMYNSIFWNNNGGTLTNIQVEAGLGGIFNAQYSIIQNNGVYPGIGNLNLNPLFVQPVTIANTPSIGGDYRLRLCSPAINAGNNGLIPAGVVEDLEGNERVYNSIVDIGAFEYIGIVPNYAVMYVDSTNGNDTSLGNSWATSFRTLSYALNVAQSTTGCYVGADSILIAAGTYVPTDRQGGGLVDATYAIKSGIKIYGGYPAGGGMRDVPANPTILSGSIDMSGNVCHVMVIAGVSNANDSIILDGLTFTNGGISGSASPETFNINGIDIDRRHGGGVYIGGNNDSSVILFRSCVFTRNGTNSGGGMFNTGSSLQLDNCIFNNNGAGVGGGLYNVYFSSVIKDCVFSNNTAGRGAGMFNASSSPDLINCIFIGNTASGNSGGMENSRSSPRLTNCVFTGNVANGYSYYSGQGGGMNNLSNSSPQLNNCIFKNNNAAQEGGGMHNEQSSPVLINSVFTGNSTNVRGGGMSNLISSSPKLSNCIFTDNSTQGTGGAIYNQNTTAEFSNCTFSNNTAASTNGHSIHQAASGTTVLHNSIVWKGASLTGNNINITGTGTIDATYSNIQQVSGVYAGAGNINEVPLFADVATPAGADEIFGTADDGLRLLICSPAIDAGSNVLISSGVTADISGNARISGVHVDMGAYENRGFSLHHTANTTLPANEDCTTSDGWRHFYHNDGTENKIFVSVNTHGQDIGAVTVATRLNEHYGDSSLVLTDPYLQVPFHIPFNRSWMLSSANTFVNPVSIRFYFADRDSMDLVKTFPLSSLDELIAYKVDGMDIWDKNSTGYKRHMLGVVSGLNTYVYGNFKNIRYAQFQVNEFSTGTLALMTNVLPLELLNFTATAIGDKAYLQWHTVNEQDVSRFGIERSLDAGNWETLHIVSALNGQEQFYDITDEFPHEGVNYYRLKMTDYDGSYKYSRVEDVTFVKGETSNTPKYLIYPNPNNGNFIIRSVETRNENLQIQLYDGLGRMIYSDMIRDGEHRISIENLSSGMYYLTIQQNDVRRVEKIVIE